MPNCDWLIHDGSVDTGDMTIRQFNSFHGYMDSIRKHMLEIYSEVCSASGPKFKNMKHGSVKNFIRRRLQSKEDWWLTATEAVEYGFVDGIYGSPGYESIGGMFE